MLFFFKFFFIIVMIFKLYWIFEVIEKMWNFFRSFKSLLSVNVKLLNYSKYIKLINIYISILFKNVIRDKIKFLYRKKFNF